MNRIILKTYASISSMELSISVKHHKLKQNRAPVEELKTGKNKDWGLIGELI
jgi:hypothetical protein